MKVLVCMQCGASDLQETNGVAICRYCGTRYTLSAEDCSSRSSVSTSKIGNSQIAIPDDVERLLQKCKKDPKNARKYANLILDIDPDNEEALTYL